jgi:hypothetical protein
MSATSAADIPDNPGTVSSQTGGVQAPVEVSGRVTIDQPACGIVCSSRGLARPRAVLAVMRAVRVAQAAPGWALQFTTQAWGSSMARTCLRLRP